MSWYRRRDLNPHPETGHDFESCVSTIPPLRLIIGLQTCPANDSRIAEGELCGGSMSCRSREYLDEGRHHFGLFSKYFMCMTNTSIKNYIVQKKHYSMTIILIEIS